MTGRKPILAVRTLWRTPISLNEAEGPQSLHFRPHGVLPASRFGRCPDALDPQERATSHSSITDTTFE